MSIDEATRLQRQAEFEALSPLRQLLVLARDLAHDCYLATHGDRPVGIPLDEADNLVVVIEQMIQQEESKP